MKLDITTQEGKATAVHMGQCIGALKIEVATGMRHSKGSVLVLVRRLYGVKSQTKKGALTEMQELYKEATGREYGSQIS